MVIPYSKANYAKKCYKETVKSLNKSPELSINEVEFYIWSR